MSARGDLLARRPAEELIPGDAEAADAFAVTLRQQGERFRWAAEDYRKVKVEWTGTAADAYRAAASTNAAAWEHAAECFGRAANAMAAYADALRAARARARTAHLDFEDGMEAAEQWARQSYEEAVCRAEQQLGVPSALTPPYLRPPRVILATLPGGRALRDGAVDAVEAARADLAAAGTETAAVLRQQTEGYGSTPPFGMTPGTDGNPTGKGDHFPINGPVPTSPADLDLTRIKQGQIGDCWLLSGMGVLADADLDWLRQHLVLNPDGSYTVTLYRTHDPLFGPTTYEPVSVTVPASVISDGAQDSKTGQPSWASIIEKAAAMLRGGDYGDINGGWGDEALELLTGHPASNHDDQSLSEIQAGLARGDCFVASTETSGSWWPFDDEVDDKGIVPDHMYMIDRVEQVDGQLKIHVVNPWGPDGGNYHGDQKFGDMWLTEEEFHRNFDTTSSVATK